MENLTIITDLEKVNRDTFLKKTLIITNVGTKEESYILNCIKNAFNEDLEKIENLIIIKSEIKLNEICLNFATGIYYVTDESIKQIKSRGSSIKGFFIFNIKSKIGGILLSNIV